MNRRLTNPLVLLALATVLLFGAGGAEAQLQPSSDVLLPFFEVDLEGGTTTTKFTVVNALNRSVEARVDLHSNWGIPLLTVSLTLQPHAVESVDLADWLVKGNLPGRTLSADEVEHLKMALCGERSPKDKLYYATEFTRGFATGYVTLRTLGTRPDALWGEFFVIDSKMDIAQGDTLVNIDTTTGCPGTCERHLLRFLTQDKELAANTKVVIWTGRTGQPSSTALTADDARQVEADAIVYNDLGLPVDTRKINVLPVQRVSVEELGLSSKNGWVDLKMAVGSFVGLSYGDDDRHSVALQAYCAPPETFSVPGPGISLRKLTNGDDANLPPGPSITVGGQVTWTYEVKNTGKVHLADIKVTDDQGVAVTCPADELAPSQSMSCTGKGTAVACQYTNTGKVAAKSPTGIEVGAEDISHYFGQHNAALEIETLINGQDADTAPGPVLNPGQAVAWTYVVTNKGAVRLNDVKVTDDKGVAVTCPRQMLRPGESMTCTASGNAGTAPYANIGTASGLPPCGPAVNDSDPSNYTVSTPENAKIDIEKHTNGQDADTPTGPEITVGAPVLWEYFVTNTGDVALSNVKVTDDKGVAVSCPQTSLNPKASMRCTGNGTAAAGQYKNVGTVTGTSPKGVTVADTDPSHYLGRIPDEGAKIDIEKHTNGQDADTPTGPEIAVGAPVLWEYFVTNLGNVALSSIKVTDDKGVAVSCPQTSLNPGASMRCTGNGTAVAGQYKNIGTATGTSPQGKTVSDSDPSHYFGKETPENPCIDIKKHTNGQDADNAPGPEIAVGAAVLWEYFVTNSGDAALSNVKVTDDKGVVVSCPQTSLAIGASMRCTGNGTAVAGQYKNIGTVTGTSPKGTVVNDSDPSHYYGKAPKPEVPCIKIEKKTNGQDADSAPGPEIAVGAAVLWEYYVSNVGDVTLSNVKVTDDKGVAVSCPQTSLAPGASMRCTGNGTATAGQYKNIGTATGTSPKGTVVNDSDPSHYYGKAPKPEAPCIKIEKKTNGEDADYAPGPYITVGSPVTWDYYVSNAGDVTLSNIKVTDDKGVAVSCPQTSLSPGATMRCTGSGTATAGQYKNIGTATGTSPKGTVVNDSDPSHYYGKSSSYGGKQGCSPGYWKTHSGSWPATGYSPSQKVNTVFKTYDFWSLGYATLQEALAFSGGSGDEGAARSLLRQAVAGLLNASHSGVSYPRSASGLVADVNDELKDEDRDDMLDLADDLDKENNLGCPLN